MAPLSRTVLLAYALPGVPLAMLSLPVYVFVPQVYASTFGLSLAGIGLVLLTVRLFDAITDPFVGYVSDAFEIRGERRRPYLLIAIIPVVLGTWMVMRPPGEPGYLYLALWSAVLSIGWTLAIIPYNAWGAELSQDYAGRNRVTGYREGLVVVGTVIAASLPAVLPPLGLQGEAAVLAVIALIVAITVPITFMIAIFAVPEPQNFSWRSIAWREGLGVMRRNGPFKRLIVAFVLNGFANGLPASLFLFFSADVLQAGAAQGPLLLLYFVCGILGIPLWFRVSSAVGKHRSWCFAMIVACAAFICVPFLGAGDIIPFAIICVITGLALGADLTLPASMQADVIDADTVESGSQRSAVYFSAWSMATKITLALAAGVALPTLDLFGYVPNSESTDGLFALAILYSLVPTLFKLAAIALMWGFPLTEDAQSNLRKQIEQEQTA
ncbi:MAG: MFS transporter [Pseudomonadota bacterium]